MVEYGLIVAVIAVMAVSVLTLLGRRTEGTFTTVAVAMESGSTPNGSDQGSAGPDVDSGSGGNPNSGSDEEGDPNDQGQGGQDDQGQGGQDDQGQGGQQDEELDQTGGEDDPASGGDQNGGADDDQNGGGDNGQQDEEQEEEEKEEEVELPSLATGSSSEMFWWDSWNKQGQWKASVSYRNETNRHQYLKLEVTKIEDDGRKTTSIVNDFYVGAGSSATYTLWNNDIRNNKGAADGVVEVQVKVLSVKTSDQNWQTYNYDVTDRPASVAAPRLP